MEPTTTIFNDLLFESPAAQAEFHEATSRMDAAEAEKLRSVLGKPSQFVGRVLCLAAAQEHWQRWAMWQATEGAELEKGRRELAAEARPSREQTKARKAALEAAKEAWHAAVAEANANMLEWSAWEKAQIEMIRKAARDAAEQREALVRQARENYRRLRDAS